MQQVHLQQLTVHTVHWDTAVRLRLRDSIQCWSIINIFQSQVITDTRLQYPRQRTTQRGAVRWSCVALPHVVSISAVNATLLVIARSQYARQSDTIRYEKLF